MSCAMEISCTLDSMSRRFKKAYVEISDICGLSCSFCPSIKGKRGAMDLNVFEKICFELAGKCDRMTLHLLGDPLRNPLLPDYLRIASDFNHQIEIVTSGYYLKKWDAKVLLFYPIVQFNLSLSAYTDPNNPKKATYLKECLEFAKLHQELQSSCFLNLRMHKSRLDDEIATWFCKSFNVPYKFSKDRIRLGKYLFLTLSKDFNWIDALSKNFNQKKTCYGVISQIGFLADGRVVPCCIDCEGKISLGDINTQSLDEILSSSLARNIQDGFQKGIAYHLQCQICTYPAKK